MAVRDDDTIKNIYQLKMLVIRKKRYVKKYRVGGSGIFDALTKLISSDTAKALGLSRAATSDIGKAAISAGKTAAKELTTAAILAAKDAAIEKLSKKKSHLTQQNRDILDSLVRNGGAGLRLAAY